MKRFMSILVITALIFCSAAVMPASAAGMTPVKVKVGKKSFEAEFYDNKTSRKLLKNLPVKLKMSELNGNEKYKYLGYDLPAKEKKVRKIKAGDIMLYGTDCLVIFYKSFETTYEYTRVGKIRDVKGLKKAAGKGSVTVRISKKKKK